MANIKIGLDYFAFDVDFFDNDKIEFLGARFGLRGENIAIRLLCRIYRSKGYYCTWGTDEALLFAKRTGDGCTAELAEQVAEELVEREFFDRELYRRYGVLTSREIQKRYIEAAAKRSRVELRAELLLIAPESRPNIVILGDTGGKKTDSDAVLPQSKGKEKKGEEREKTASVPEPPSRDNPGDKSLSDDGKKETADSAAQVSPTVPKRVGTEGRTADETEFLALLTADGPQREAVRRRFGLSPGEQERWAVRFCDKLAAEGCTRKNRTDLFRHFNNWLNLELHRPKRTDLRPPQGQAAQILSKFRNR